ncbi:hypothetical protein IAQ61_007286 [Plenodomus lingam]|uniref:uncharacterized protein n=1 Tax=Leptosphaeria maculans TaxID=5022 RepID=UPI0033222EFB|nr:hypothetical protein IAQ61_007286 [Plenodomus lingam]
MQSAEVFASYVVIFYTLGRNSARVHIHVACMHLPSEAIAQIRYATDSVVSVKGYVLKPLPVSSGFPDSGHSLTGVEHLTSMRVCAENKAQPYRALRQEMCLLEILHFVPVRAFEKLIQGFQTPASCINNSCCPRRGLLPCTPTQMMDTFASRIRLERESSNI